MKRMLSTLVAIAALGSTVSAQAAPAIPCLTKPEMHGLIAYFLPDVITEVTKNCGASLPGGSYARTGLPQLGAQLAQNKEASWPMAKAAFLKMAGPQDIKTVASLPDAALRPLVDAAIGEKMAIPVTPSACADVNDIAEALAPLTPDQSVHLLATIFSAVARKDDKLRSCPREAG